MSRSQDIFKTVYRIARYGRQNRSRLFTEIHEKNEWNDPESVSGPGSNLEQTTEVRKQLPGLIRKFGVRSLLDIPCGDFHWMKETPLGVERYVGADVVSGLIEANRKAYAVAGREFVMKDAILDPLPKVDLIFSRDCLVHLSLTDALLALANFKRSGSRYLLTTTFTRVEANGNIRTGQWRPLNFQKSPFHFSSPIEIIDEKCTEVGGKYSDKALGLWDLSKVFPEHWVYQWAWKCRSLFTPG